MKPFRTSVAKLRCCSAPFAVTLERFIRRVVTWANLKLGGKLAKLIEKINS